MTQKWLSVWKRLQDLILSWLWRRGTSSLWDTKMSLVLGELLGALCLQLSRRRSLREMTTMLDLLRVTARRLRRNSARFAMTFLVSLTSTWSPHPLQERPRFFTTKCESCTHLGYIPSFCRLCDQGNYGSSPCNWLLLLNIVICISDIFILNIFQRIKKQENNYAWIWL